MLNNDNKGGSDDNNELFLKEEEELQNDEFNEIFLTFQKIIKQKEIEDKEVINNLQNKLENSYLFHPLYNNNNNNLQSLQKEEKYKQFINKLDNNLILELIKKYEHFKIYENDKNLLNKLEDLKIEMIDTLQQEFKNLFTTGKFISNNNPQEFTNKEINNIIQYKLQNTLPFRFLFTIFEFLINGNRLHEKFRYPNFFVYQQLGELPYLDHHYLFDNNYGLNNLQEQLNNLKDDFKEENVYNGILNGKEEIARGISNFCNVGKFTTLLQNLQLLENEKNYIKLKFIEIYKKYKNNLIIETIKSSINEDGDWKSISLVNQGNIEMKNIYYFYEIFQFLNYHFQICYLPIGYVYFSLLKKNSHILQHCGVTNVKLRIQLPIIYHESLQNSLQNKKQNNDDVDNKEEEQLKCIMKVKGVEREYKEGEVLVLDDSFIHEVIYKNYKKVEQEELNEKVEEREENDIDDELKDLRVVLLIDIYHPELTNNEIEMLNHFFEKLQ